jgi:hypothetical protein
MGGGRHVGLWIRRPTRGQRKEFGGVGVAVSDRDRLSDLLAAAARAQQRWDWPEAHDLLQRALDAADVAGVRDTELAMLTCRRMLAETLRELGHIEQAREMVLPLLADCQTYAGPAHPATLRTSAVAASVLHDFGSLDAAEQLYHRVVDARPNGDGPAARAVMLARANLALLHRDRGNLAGALGVLGKVFSEFRRQYGTEDLDTIRIAVELADLHHRCGEIETSRRLLSVAHAAARGAYGERHRITAVVESELTSIEPEFPPPPDALLSSDGLLESMHFNPPQPAALPYAASAPPYAAPPPPIALPAPSNGSPSAGSPSSSPPSNGSPWSGAPSNGAHPPHRPGSPILAASPVLAVPPEVPTTQPGWVSRPLPSRRSTALAKVTRAGLPVHVARPVSAHRMRPRRMRTAGLVGLAAAVVTGTAAVAVGLAHRGGSDDPPQTRTLSVADSVGETLDPAPADAPIVPGQSPPGDVQLLARDNGTTLSVTWTDPSGGRAPFVVAVAPAGEHPTIDAALQPGTTQYLLHGMDPKRDYCVVIGVYYDPATVTKSTATCTTRNPKATPTKTG